MNHSPLVFGLPGTETGDIGSRTQVSGDWGGTRTEMVRHGVFIDAYSTTTYQDVTSGGLKEIDALAQSTDVAINLDTGRLGWWPMGIIHLGIMSRYGSDQGRTWTAGSWSPTSTASLYPTALDSRATCPTEYYLVQAVTAEHVVIVGQLNTLYVADQNTFASNYRYQFQNLALNGNPMLAGYFNQVAVVAADAWVASKHFRLYTAITDPNTQGCKFPSRAFRDVTYFQEGVYKYDAGDLPGAVRGGWAFTSKEQMRLPGGGGPGAFGSVPGPAVGVSNARMFFVNFEQYLKVSDGPDARQQKKRTCEPHRGYGVFGRFGVGPSRSNRIDLFESLGIGGYGLADSRPNDRFGVGWYSSHFSRDLGSGMRPNEQGIEAFYSVAVTPAVQVTPSFQYIWNPLIAGLFGENRAALWGLRLEMAL
jgi:porin